MPISVIAVGNGIETAAGNEKLVCVADKTSVRELLELAYAIR